MRHLIRCLGVLVLAATPTAGQFTSPTLFVVRVATANNSVTLRNYNPATGLFGTDQAVSDTGASALTMTPTATSEGALTVSPNGRYLGFTGFRTGTNAGTTDRVVGLYDVQTGTVNTATAIPNAEAYGTSSIRSAVWDDAGGRYWSSGTGAGGGTRTNTFGATSGSVQVSTTVTNTRVLGVSNGQLFTTASSGANIGLNAVGTGLPTSTGNMTTQIPNTSVSGSAAPQPSPYGFALSPSGLTLYMADDRSITNGGGIQKWTRPDTASAFNLVTTFGTGATSTVGTRGLAVDFSTTDPTVYATTAEGSANRVISFIDTGIASPTLTVLDIAGTGTIYRGVAFSPVPEPGSVLGLAAGVAALVAVIRRRVRSGSGPSVGRRP